MMKNNGDHGYIQPYLHLYSVMVTITCIILGGMKSFAQDNHVALTRQHNVLITGFYDWRGLGHPPEIYRCKENPSCRVLTGVGVGERGYKGGLAKKLTQWSDNHPNVKVNFRVLPVTWKHLGLVKRDRYQIIIHLGLGVYDSFHNILIEEGAYNLHRGKDAMGHRLNQVIRPHQPTVLNAPIHIRRGIERALKAKLPPPFSLTKVKAREKNTYLCNATHYEALEFINKAMSTPLPETYFVHIPHREGDTDEALTLAIFNIIKALVLR